MMEGIFFADPQLLYALPIPIIAAIIYLFKGKDRLLVLSRAVVICLLIVALANPYMVTTTEKDVKRPRITILADETDSMKIFDSDIAGPLQSSLPDTQIRYFSGTKTPLGDKIIQYSSLGEAMLLVSDGQSNSGRPLSEALSLAHASNTSVYAVSMDPVRNEVGVEIDGVNTAVSGADYPFKIIIHKTGSSAKGTVKVFADEDQIYEDTLENANESIRISHRFVSTGPHILRATISPEDDYFTQNNEYQKAIYVVPKPKVFLEAESDSPLKTVLMDLYDVDTDTQLPSSLDGYKAVVLDNIKYDSSLDALKDYVLEGGGLVVVGGQTAYELGGYYNTPFETSLPVVSAPSIFQGGKIMLIIMDISGSTMSPMITGQTATYLDYEKSLAIELLKSPELRDARVGVVVFGTRAYVVSQPVPLSKSRSVLEDSIKSLQTPIGKDETNLDDSLKLAWQILNTSQGEEGELVVISDGRLEPDKIKGDNVFENSARIIKAMNVTCTLMQVQTFAGSTGRFSALASATGSSFYPLVYPDTITIHMGEAETTEPEEPSKDETGFDLVITNTDHYITQDLTLNAKVSGFNDVTPRLGAQRLVAMSDGKPILSVMRYGLGRSVAVSTDDGDAWAPNLYSVDNSALVSAAVNWAVGDPRPEDQRIDSEDGYVGSQLQITITTPTPPKLYLDVPVAIERAGEDSYVATITPTDIGIIDIGDYSIAVNYPLEYRDIGFNTDFEDLIQSFGGRLFTTDEVRKSLVEEARKASERIVQERTSRRTPLLLAALIIFLTEVVIRRFKEVRRRKSSR